MNKHASFPTPHAVNVDWDTPHLQTLLEKTESWQIDNRGSSRLERAAVFVGWGWLSGRPATIAWEDDHKVVFLITFPIPGGERIRLEKPISDSARNIWGEVEECRAGRRAGDEERGIHIVWMRKQEVSA